MRKLMVTMWTSLDGYIAGPDGELDWILGDADMSAYEIGLVSNADTLLFGRETYQDFTGYWPHVPANPEAPEWEQTFARHLNRMDKVVLSRTLETADWSESTILRELTPEAIAALKAKPGKDIVIYGSASIVQQLTNLGLIDEYHLLVHPVLLGGGSPLFEHIQQKVELELVSHEPFQSGVQLLAYRVAEA